jgi:hypothetical protein
MNPVRTNRQLEFVVDVQKCDRHVLLTGCREYTIYSSVHQHRSQKSWNVHDPRARSTNGTQTGQGLKRIASDTKLWPLFVYWNVSSKAKAHIKVDGHVS